MCLFAAEFKNCKFQGLVKRYQKAISPVNKITEERISKSNLV